MFVTFALLINNFQKKVIFTEKHSPDSEGVQGEKHSARGWDALSETFRPCTVYCASRRRIIIVKRASIGRLFAFKRPS